MRIKTNYLGLIFIMILSMQSLNMFAYDVAVENSDGVTLYYNLINNNTELEVTKGGSNCYYYYSVINIPNEVNYSGKLLKVKSIGQAAFDYCSNLTSITIPNSITTIGASAFAGCGLNTIDIPNSVTTIGRLAFYGCDNLKTVTIPNSVDSLAEATFNNCI